MTQAAQFHCDDCGQTVDVRQLTVYEFAAPCRCDRVISWAHKDPPPTFQGLTQGELFT